MKTFIGDDFLLKSEAARILYHEHAKKMPIFDYHCHLNPQEIYEDVRFDDLAHAWLGGDHYKWRVMRANAVPERFVTGDAPGREKFDRYAEVMPHLIGNPIYHWSHLELIRFFGIDDLLDPTTADGIWDKANAKLQSSAGSARSLILESNVRALCTTDDPIDDLQWHKKLAADATFPVQVLPTFRPEKALNIVDPGYPAYLEKLGAAANLPIRTIDDVKQAMKGMLAPKTREVELGRAEVRAVYKISNVGTIAGAYVLEGKVARNALLRVVRDGIVLAEDKIASLKRFKDDAKEVAEGFECGITLEKFSDIKEGDVFECFKLEEYRD